MVAPRGSSEFIASVVRVSPSVNAFHGAAPVVWGVSVLSSMAYHALMNTAPSSCDYDMVLGQTARNVWTSAQVAPLQLGGGFLELAVLFLILAVIAGVLGARGVAGLSMEIAKWLVIIFVVLAIITFLL